MSIFNLYYYFFFHKSGGFYNRHEWIDVIFFTLTYLLYIIVVKMYNIYQNNKN